MIIRISQATERKPYQAPARATSKPVLVVGAGFAGACYARVLAEAGLRVDVIDRRGHVAGNAYDEVVPSGVRVHRYGPHLFHTNNERVMRWLLGFGKFVLYEHRVQAELADGRFVPLPVNRATVQTVFGVYLANEAEMRDFLQRQAEPIVAPRNAAEHLRSQIGAVLTDLFFRPYTRKMWALDLEDLSADVVKRIPIRTDDEDRYFPDDRFQMLPREGYTRVVEAILDHPLIRVTLHQAFDKSMLTSYRHCFNSMAIDEYFEYMFGMLPYRSIRFHHQERQSKRQRGTAATINFTDDGKFTRETDWSRLPAHRTEDVPTKLVTLEEPCDFRENDLERYYPVKASDGRFDTLYKRYKASAESEGRVTFIGRCGTYQYLDIHQVINQSLAGARAWVERAS